MKIRFKQPLYLKHFAVVAVVILITVLSLFFWFTWRAYSAEEQNVINQLENESGHAERAFSDTVGHTSLIMKTMIEQISKNYEDKNHINNVISKYRTNPKIDNILAWTIFSWANSQSSIIVNALYGILDKPIDLSKRDYVISAKKEPGILHFGKPVFGSISHAWMIPAGIGATDSRNKYKGTMIIGFDIENLINSFKNSIKSEGIEFALIDMDLKVILRSSNKLEELGKNNSGIPDGDLKNLLLESANGNAGKVFSKYNIFKDYQNYYFYKMRDYPYVIYLRYDYDFIKNEIWQALTSRFVEILVIGLVAIALSLFIYKREVVLRKAAEIAHKEALQASRAKTDFLAYTNHELRSPLNGIIMGSEMIYSKIFGNLHDKYVEYAREIHENGVELLHFIEDLLDEAQATSGKFSIAEQETKIDDTIHRAIKLNFSRANKNKIIINVAIEPNLPSLWIDPKRFRQIFNNLISNSIKYSPPNTLVTITAHKIHDGIEIIIADQGFGMVEEDLQTALSKYGTIKNKNTGLVESVGLGLPLVKQLVEAHGALLLIETAPNKGTKVIIRLQKERIFSDDIYEKLAQKEI